LKQRGGAIIATRVNEKMGVFVKQSKAFDKGQRGAYREILNPEPAGLTGGRWAGV
jgi:hypothetical protein